MRLEPFGKGRVDITVVQNCIGKGQICTSWYKCNMKALKRKMIQINTNGI